MGRLLHSSSLLCFLVVAVVLTAGPPRARAQQAAAGAQAVPDASRDREARSLFEAGQEAFVAGRYADALDYFKRAHALSGRAVLLYNVGVAADRMRRDDEAIAAFERYLREAPSTVTNRTEVEGRLRALREVQVQHQTATPAVTTTPPVEPSATTTPTPTPEPAADRPAAHESAPAGEHHGGGRIFTWIALGAAVAAGAGGTIVAVLANTDYDGLVQDCAARGGCTQAEIDDANLGTRATLSNILFAVGGAALVTGAVLFFVEGGRDGPEDVRVAAGVSLGGLVVRGSF